MTHVELDLPGRREDNRVVVAMSGGVDSSVVAALLKDAGYDVVGVTLQLYDHGEATHRPGSCCAGQDIHDARRVADALGIPHYVLDYEQRFKAAVIDAFADSYIAGETPVPCVSCNQKIKFHDLLDTARELGAQALATGHYIASRPAGDGSPHRALYRALDPDRDQSYFLFTTTQEQADFLRFPLGEMHKDETREIARRHGLAVAEKSDSQDICFVPTGRYAQVIEKLRPDAAEPGDIVHVDGRVLGRHDGILRYTVGQRRGIGVATGEPLYVVALDADNARVIVGPRAELETASVMLRDVNWIGDGSFDAALDAGMEVAVKVRSTRPPVAARLVRVGGMPGVELLEPETGVSPGQACVFYDLADGRGRLLGGGTIDATRSAQAVGTREGMRNPTAVRDAEVAGAR